jgi:hypothetical protein
MAQELAEAKNSVSKLAEDAKDHDKAILQTRQFQQMKKMLATKNTQLVDLRKRLQRYEPDEAEMEDED